MSETIILDPAEEAPGRAELDISTGPEILVDPDGIDWDVASVEPFSADQLRGSTPIGYRVPNRTITMRLLIQGSDAVTFDEARRKLQAKVSRIQQEGGVLKRTLTNGGVLYADLVDASLELPGSTLQATRDFEPAATLTLTALPDFYGAEVLAADVSEATAPELVTVITGIDGDFPARTRIVVSDDEGQNQKGILWSVRSRHYAADATAAMVYEAEDLELLDTAAVGSSTGAYGGTAVGHGSFTASNWTPVLGFRHDGTDYLTHEGNYRVFARAAAPYWGENVSIRLVWGIGDLRNPTRNAAWVFPSQSGFFMADLGMVRLKPPPVGSHRWDAQIQVRGADTGAEVVHLDRIYIVNVDDGYGIARAAVDTDAYGDEIARDDFNQTAGAATGKTLGVGGTWSGAGDADDFQIDGAGLLTRDEVSDTDYLANARRIYASGSSAGAQTVRVDFKHDYAVVDDLGGSEPRCAQGVVARYVDESNFVVAGILSRTWWNTYGQVVLYKRVAGTNTLLHASEDSTWWGAVNFWWRVTLQIDDDGNWSLNTSPQSAHVDEFTVTGQDDDLASSGALGEGKCGVWDGNNSAQATIRTYDNFNAVGFLADAAIFAGQSAQLLHDGVFRQDETGAAYKRLASYEGDFPRLPPATPDGRASEVLVKASRGDFATYPDKGIDDLSVAVYYRPAWLITPEDA